MAAGTILSEHDDVRPEHHAHTPRAAPPHPTAAPFWAMGLLNNSSFVIMIASAKAISEGGTALVFLCSVLPGLCVKLSAPFWFDRVSYRRRLLAASVLMAACFSTVAAFSGEESANMYMELLGVALCSVQGSMGEASLLALAGKYDNKAQDEAAVANATRTGTSTGRGDDGSIDISKPKKGKCITAFSSGTGLAGVFGFAYKFLFNQFLGLTLRKTLLLANALAFFYWACYWNYLDAHVESMNAGSSIIASYDEDDENNISNASDNKNAGEGYAIDEEGQLLANETTAMTKERPNDDIDGRGSGLELSRGYGRAGEISPTPISAKDEAEGFEDEYHEADTLSGHCHGGDDEGMMVISSLSAIERLKLSASFWPYMIPLFTVYAAEYALQAGAWTAIGFPVESELARDEFYEYSNWVYQAGVFVSRSSGTIYQASMAVFWLMPLLQCANLVLFSFVAATHVWYDYSLLILCFYVGLLGGGVYVNGYLRINSDLPKPVREFALATVSVADTIGIVVADISGLFIQSCLYQRNGIVGAVVQCPLR